MEDIIAQVRTELLKISNTDDYVDAEVARAQKHAKSYFAYRMRESERQEDWAARAQSKLEWLKRRVQEFNPDEPGSVRHGMFSEGFDAVFNATMAQLCA